MKRGIKTVVFWGLVLILIYNVTIICKSFLFPDETPSIFGFKTFVVVSGSMEPKLSVGDIVFIKKVDQNQLKEKDIISFRDGQKIVTHRIYSIFLNNGKVVYRTKGDNNNSYDKRLVDYSEIEGKVIFVIPMVGNILIFLQNRVIVILIIILFYILMLRKLYQRKRNLN